MLKRLMAFRKMHIVMIRNTAMNRDLGVLPRMVDCMLQERGSAVSGEDELGSTGAGRKEHEGRTVIPFFFSTGQNLCGGFLA